MLEVGLPSLLVINTCHPNVHFEEPHVLNNIEYIWSDVLHGNTHSFAYSF